MRKSVIILSVTAVVGVCTAGTAVAEPPPPANGIAVALDGTGLDGEAVPVSQPLVDPPLATCFDLVTPDGRPAVWADFVNRTDRVAGVSTRSCADVSAGNVGQQRELPPGGSSAGHAYRSVRFLSIP
jgi:hypothetical protein